MRRFSVNPLSNSTKKWPNPACVIIIHHHTLIFATRRLSINPLSISNIPKKQPNPVHVVNNNVGLKETQELILSPISQRNSPILNVCWSYAIKFWKYLKVETVFIHWKYGNILWATWFWTHCCCSVASYGLKSCKVPHSLIWYGNWKSCILVQEFKSFTCNRKCFTKISFLKDLRTVYYKALRYP